MNPIPFSSIAIWEGIWHEQVESSVHDEDGWHYAVPRVEIWVYDDEYLWKGWRMEIKSSPSGFMSHGILGLTTRENDLPFDWCGKGGMQFRKGAGLYGFGVVNDG